MTTALTEEDRVHAARAGDTAALATKPARYSATTIQNFEDCERLFYWPTVAGLEAPPSPAQGFGTRYHSHQESYLKTGELPPRTNAEGILASVALPLLPRPRTPGLYVEQQFEARFDDLPVAITGTRDFGVDPVDKSATSFLLGDHKTARSKRWPKTQSWLHGNIQANLYAFTKWADLYALGFEQLRIVDKQWIYAYKDERQAERLRSVDDLDHVREQFDARIKPLVLRMHALATAAPRAGDVALPEDRSVCEAYGGCPHRARCFGFGLSDGVMGPGASRFSKAGLRRASLAVVEVQPAAAAAKQEETSVGVLAGKFSKEQLAAKASTLRATGAGSAINPQKAPLVKAAPPPAVEEPNDEPATEQEEAQQEKPKKTRAKKPAGAEQLVADTAAKVDAAFAPRTPGKALNAPGSNPAHDFWLFVGCAPAKGFEAAQVFAEEIVGAAQAAAAQRLNAGHYREGQGNYGVLEACFAAWLEEHALAGAVIIDPNAIVARDVIGLLRAHANVVIERRM